MQVYANMISYCTDYNPLYIGEHILIRTLNRLCLQSLLRLANDLNEYDSFCKQFGPRSGRTEYRVWPGTELFDTLMVLMKDFFEKINFKKKISRWQNYPVGKESLGHVHHMHGN